MNDATPAPLAPQAAPAGLPGRLRAWLGDRGTNAVAQRFASLTFLFRLGNAAIAFLSQILLARWMGQHEFGIYIYVWTWVILLGTVTTFGLGSSPQRFVPTYTHRGDLAGLRGFILGSRLLGLALASACALAGALLLWLLQDRVSPWLLVPAVLGLASLPAYVVQDVQDGIARAYDWSTLAMAPAYLVRPVLLIGLIGLLHLAGYAPSASTAMIAALIATWMTTVWQLIVLNARLRRQIPAGPRHMAPREWLRVSGPQFLVESFYLLLTYCDLIILERFVDPGQMAVYYAATKLVALVAFVYFAVAAASAHKFTQFHVAGRTEDLHAFLRTAVRWTFLPSLAMAIAILALGKPLLSLFGAGFDSGYPVMLVLMVGLLARASLGPVEKLLTMTGHQGFCARVYGVAFLANIGLSLLLVPHWGLIGAAAATATALVAESVMLFAGTRKRLGLHAFVLGGPRPASAPEA